MVERLNRTLEALLSIFVDASDRLGHIPTHANDGIPNQSRNLPSAALYLWMCTFLYLHSSYSVSGSHFTKHAWYRWMLVLHSRGIHSHSKLAMWLREAQIQHLIAKECALIRVQLMRCVCAHACTCMYTYTYVCVA